MANEGAWGSGLSGFMNSFNTARTNRLAEGRQRTADAMQQKLFDIQMAEAERVAKERAATNALSQAAIAGGMMSQGQTPVPGATAPVGQGMGVFPTASVQAPQKIGIQQILQMTPEQQQKAFGRDFQGADISKLATTMKTATPAKKQLTAEFLTYKNAFPEMSDREIMGKMLSDKQAGKTPSSQLFEKPDGSFAYVEKGGDVPSGWKPSNAGGVNVTLGSDKPIQTEKTRLLTLAGSGFDAVKKGRDLFFKNGDYNSSLAKLLATPDWVTASGALGQEASQAYNAMYGAVQDKLRLESGAAIPPDEIRQALRRYMPAPFDTEDTAKQKIDSLYKTLDIYNALGSQGLDVTAMTKAGVPIEQMEQMVSGKKENKTKTLTYNPETGSLE